MSQPDLTLPDDPLEALGVLSNTIKTYHASTHSLAQRGSESPTSGYSPTSGQMYHIDDCVFRESTPDLSSSYPRQSSPMDEVRTYSICVCM